MTLIIPPEHFQCVIHFACTDYTDGEALCTLGINGPSGAAPADAAVAVAVAFNDANLETFLATNVTVPIVEAFTETSSGLASTTMVGNQGAAMLPTNCNLLVEKRAPVRGRRAQGRNFYPSMLTEGDVSASGQINPTIHANLQTAFDDFYENLVTAEFLPVILQNEEGVSPPISPPPKVTRFIVDPQISTLRRRMRR